MKIFIATCVRLTKVKDKLYLTAPFASILMRYYNEFGAVTLCTRVKNAEVPDEKLVDVTRVIETLVPLKKLTDVLKPHVKKQIEEELSKCELLTARVNSFVAFKIADIAKKPYFVEIMSCAWDTYWNHSLKGKIVAPYMFLKMKQVVKKADYALYVTNEFLQNRYPATGKNIGISNVKIAEISDEIIAQRLEKIKNADKKNITLMTSAAVNVKYKGQEYVIKAIKELKNSGINATYKLAGGGSNERLLNIAKRYGVEENVVFLGSLSHDEVFKNLDETDVYVQPSLQEGLPRAVVEAMSRGCICIGARTGGIPELLQDRFVLRRKNVKDIVNAIKNICEKEDWEAIIKENFEKAREYEETKLDKKRNEFYKMIKEEIEQ